MSNECKHCQVFILLERKRIDWYEKLSTKNIELNDQIAKQQVLINILEEKLSKKRTTVLLDHIRDQFQKDKLHELDEYFALLKTENDSLKKQLIETENELCENLTSIKKAADFFRQHLFQELESANNLKQYLFDEIKKYKRKADDLICEKIRDEKDKLCQEFKRRYQGTIKKSREEMERRDLLVSKLKQHNKQLYARIYELKKENQEEVLGMKNEIKYLKSKLTNYKNGEKML